MALALEETVLLGLTTNREFLLDLLAHPVFADGEATTTFIERHMPDWQPPEQEIPPEALIAAALSEIQPTGAVEGLPGEPDPYSPWRRADRFRLGGGEVGDAARGSG
jgi:acetyl/propionyl-CoA carboxylase alpha subunit